MATTTTPPQQNPSQPDDTPPMPGLPGGAPLEVRQAADGAKLTGANEKTAVGWLCGPVAPLPYTVTVQYDTPEGLKPLKFHMIQLDSGALDVIEKRNRVGDGPFAELNARVYNAEVVTEATRFIEDLTDGTKLQLNDPTFLMGIPSPAIAMEKRFAYQPGILRGLVAEIREMAGNSDDRIGTAQRVLVDAAGNS